MRGVEMWVWWLGRGLMGVSFWVCGGQGGLWKGRRG